MFLKMDCVRAGERVSYILTDRIDENNIAMDTASSVFDKKLFVRSLKEARDDRGESARRKTILDRMKTIECILDVL
jgi:hypothetical protein